MSDCLFCRIASGEIPAKIVHQDDAVVAFRDINPQAPTHLLVIPRRHLVSLAGAGAGDDPLIGRLFRTAAEIADREGIAGNGFRVVANAGDWAGQTVPHLHVHLLGGRRMAWPPG